MTMTDSNSQSSTTTNVAEVQASELARVITNAALFTSPPADAYPSLAAIRVTCKDDEVSVESTERHVLYREQFVAADFPSGTFFVAGEEIKPLVAMLKAHKAGWVQVCSDGFGALVVRCGGQSMTMTAQFDYPPVDKLRNVEPGSLETLGLSLHFLGLIGKVKPSEDVDRRKSSRYSSTPGATPARFSFSDSNLKAQVVTIGAAIDLLVMPVKLS